MNKIGIIINPNAKRIRRSRKNLTELLRSIGGATVTVEETSSIEEIPLKLQIFRRNRILVIAICGGDGTIHQVLTQIINIWGEKNIPDILILPLGTMNNVARTLGMRGKGPAVLKRLIKSLDSGKDLRTEVRYTMKIENRYCFLFGAGFTSHFLDAVYSGSEKGVVQNWKVIGGALKDIFTSPDGGPLFKPLEADITYNNVKVPFKRITGILSGTVEHIGMGFKPMPDATKPGSFQAIISGMKPGEFLKNLNRLRTGREIKHPMHINTCAKVLSIHASVPFRYTMDGDMYSCEGDLKVKLGPGINLVRI